MIVWVINLVFYYHKMLLPIYSKLFGLSIIITYIFEIYIIYYVTGSIKLNENHDPLQQCPRLLHNSMEICVYTLNVIYLTHIINVE